MKLIDKDALTEKLWERRVKNRDFGGSPYSEYGHEDDEILSLIDTLEVKDVDLDKELESWRHNHFHGRRDKESSGEYLERITQLELAKHFFELSLRVQKGE